MNTCIRQINQLTTNYVKNSQINWSKNATTSYSTLRQEIKNVNVMSLNGWFFLQLSLVNQWKTAILFDLEAQRCMYPSYMAYRRHFIQVYPILIVYERRLVIGWSNFQENVFVLAVSYDVEFYILKHVYYAFIRWISQYQRHCVFVNTQRRYTAREGRGNNWSF